MGVVEGFEVFDEVVLLELADGGEDGWLDLHKICKRKYKIIRYGIWVLIRLKRL